ncbi:hypothetical protein THS27_07140 [Thalassospira sp. MCCC 1A01428]|nr:hypothetical protein THS27_07140 [Thalassospira sp. MCCC 1A01428]
MAGSDGFARLLFVDGACSSKLLSARYCNRQGRALGPWLTVECYFLPQPVILTMRLSGMDRLFFGENYLL